jgi:tetratricopeptide (TPR) repeat protein
MKCKVFLQLILFSFAAGTAWPDDTIFTNTSERALIGEITGMTPTSISFKPVKDGPPEIAVNEVKRIAFASSPPSLIQAQLHMLAGEYDKALEYVKNEPVQDKRPEIAQEIAFSRAYCMAQLTLSGEVELKDAAVQMMAFLKDNPNSYHYYKGCEVLGDLCVAAGAFGKAQEQYAKLSQAPWPDYQIRAQVALGRAYLAQDSAAAAEKAFDEALGNSAPGSLADAQRIAAQIGKARCLALAGRVDQALRSLNELIDKLDDRNPEINALAYNAQGTALCKANKLDKAVLAFLRVHLIYNLQPDSHAEAVANLEKLFKETHKPQHAQEMRNILDERYKSSRWAKGVK